MSSEFEQTASETRYEGRIVNVRIGTFRHEDGEEVTREIVDHDGAVAVVVHDGEQLWLVRQPREAIGDPGLLELPAGKRDVEDEPPLETAKRELVEEIGKAAGSWEHLKTYWVSAGITNEQVDLYVATDLRDEQVEDHDENERIDIVTWPLDDLDALIDEVTDAKTLIGLLLFRRLRKS